MIELTAAGRRKFEAMRRREQAVLADLRLPLGRAELEETADRLRALRLALADHFQPDEG